MKGDYTDTASLDAAYAGNDTLMMISGLNVLQRVPEHENAINAARKAGISHIVYTSVSGAHPRNRTPSSTDHTATEALLRTSGINYTCLRNQAYSEFATDQYAAGLMTGQFHFVGNGDGKFSPVTRADIALCAATILREPDKHQNVVYEITGPELISFRELAGRFAEMYGRPIEYVGLTPEEMWAKFDEWGAPRVGDPSANSATETLKCMGSNELVENYIAWDEQLHAILSHHVEYITGKKPTPLYEVMLAAKPGMEAFLKSMEAPAEQH